MVSSCPSGESRGYYQDEDLWMDYQIWYANGYPYRGPKPDLNKDYISAIGAAQVFGRYVSFPFPSLLSNFCNIGCANLGTAGKGPSSPHFFDNMDIINKSKLCVVTVMSGRSVGNRYWSCYGGNNYGKNELNGEECVGQVFWEYVIRELYTGEVRDLIHETRNQYIEEFKRLFTAITVPTIFLYMSKFGYCEYKLDLSDTNSLFGCFPQMVDKDTVMNISQFSDQFVEVIYKSEPERIPAPQENHYAQQFLGLPKELMAYNNYYPTSKEHFATLDALLPTVERIIKDG